MEQSGRNQWQLVANRAHQERGRIVFDLATGAILFEAGPHEFTFHGDSAALCAYLSPGG